MILEAGTFLGEATEHRTRRQTESYSDYFRDAASDLSPLMATAIADIFAHTLDTTKRGADVAVARADISTYISAQLVAKHFATTGFSGQEFSQSVSASTQRDYAKYLTKHGINITSLEDRVAGAIEHIVFARNLKINARLASNNKSTVQVEGSFAEAAQESVLRLAGMSLASRVAGINEFSTTAEAERFSKIDTEMKRIATGRIDVKQGVHRIAQLLSPVLFERAESPSYRLEKASLSIESDMVRVALSKFGETLSMNEKRQFVGGKRLHAGDMTLSASDYHIPKLGMADKTLTGAMNAVERSVASHMSAAGNADVWKGLSKLERIAASLLVVYNNATLQEKVSMLFQDPTIIHVISRLPADMQRHFASWSTAAVAVSAVDTAADTYAMTMDTVGGFAAKAAMTVKKSTGGVGRFFSTPQNENQPDGPRKPHWGRIAITVTVVGAIGMVISACGTAVPSASTDVPDKTPVPDSIPTSVDLVQILQPTLTPQLSAFNISVDSGCIIPSTTYDHMTSLGSSVSMDMQLKWLDDALHSSNVPELSKNSTLMCSIDSNDTSVVVFIQTNSPDATVLVPTPSGFVEGTISETGQIVVVPSPTSESPPQADGSPSVFVNPFDNIRLTEITVSGNTFTVHELVKEVAEEDVRSEINAGEATVFLENVNHVSQGLGLGTVDVENPQKWTQFMRIFTTPDKTRNVAMYIGPHPVSGKNVMSWVMDSGSGKQSIDPFIPAFFTEQIGNAIYDYIEIPATIDITTVNISWMDARGGDHELDTPIVSALTTGSEPKIMVYDALNHIWVEQDTVFDPNRPPDATGVENGMFYMDAEDGYRYFFKENTLGNGEVDRYWARPLIENYYAYDDYEFNAIPITVWVKRGTPGAENIVKMTHKNVTDWDDRAPITAQLNGPLMDLFDIDKTSSQSIQELRAILNSENGMPFTFTVNGKPMEGRFGTHSGVEVTMVDKSELIDLVDQNLALAVQGTQGKIYYTVDGVKEDGTVMFRIAHDLPIDKLLINAPNGDREYEFRKLVVLPLANLLVPDSDQLEVYNLTLAGILASRTGFDRQDGIPDLDIVLKTE